MYLKFSESIKYLLKGTEDDKFLLPDGWSENSSSPASIDLLELDTERVLSSVRLAVEVRVLDLFGSPSAELLASC